MKIKKFLEKVAEEDRESLINDGDIEFLASIGVDYNKKKAAAAKELDASYYLTAKAFSPKALMIGIASFLVAVIAVSIILYYYLKPVPVTPPLQYFEDNFVEVDSNLQELNSDLKLFSMTVDDAVYELDIKKTYDSLSGDDLYFTLEFSAKQGLSKKFRLEVVVNSLYEHDDTAFDKEPIEKRISEYTIKYAETSNPMVGSPFITVKSRGEMQIGEQYVYITKYDEIALGQSSFIETLQSIISFN